LMYIASTSTVLAYIPVAQVDLAAPVPQVMQAGFGSTVVGWAFAATSVGVYCFALIATLIVVVGMVARLPMAAGWDGLLPAWSIASQVRYSNQGGCRGFRGSFAHGRSQPLRRT
jgi:glutamate:GABA antiporter